MSVCTDMPVMPAFAVFEQRLRTYMQMAGSTELVERALPVVLKALQSMAGQPCTATKFVETLHVAIGAANAAGAFPSTQAVVDMYNLITRLARSINDERFQLETRKLLLERRPVIAPT